MWNRRLSAATATGALLGIVCIVGASIRSGFDLSPAYLFAFWFNRLLMGLVIGLTGGQGKQPIFWQRGIALGVLVSFAFYSAAGYQDLIGFLAGIVYGIIIAWMADRYGESQAA
jgi:hypothetical protein